MQHVVFEYTKGDLKGFRTTTMYEDWEEAELAILTHCHQEGSIEECVGVYDSSEEAQKLIDTPEQRVLAALL